MVFLLQPKPRDLTGGRRTLGEKLAEPLRVQYGLKLSVDVELLYSPLHQDLGR